MGKDYQEHGLYLHNWHRKRHGSPKMVLNDRLNQAADAYAYKLACRRTLQHTSGLDYNENLYMSIGDRSKTKKQHVYAACEGWYNEKKFYNYSRPGFSMQTGHFTAMLWKNSTNLGIGYGESNGYIVIVACYKPHANGSMNFRDNVLPYREVDDSDGEDEKKEEVKKKAEKQTQIDTQKVEDGDLKWVKMASGKYPPCPVLAGQDGGKDVYVARAEHEGGLIPGKLHAGYEGAFVGYGGIEHGKQRYEVLEAPKGSVSWLKSRNGEIPSNAIQGGKDPNGDLYYIGRALVSNVISVGKIHGPHKGCYVTYAGYEYWFGDGYDILVNNETKGVDKKKSETAQDSAKETAGTASKKANVEIQEEEQWDFAGVIKSQFEELCDDKKTIGWEEVQIILNKLPEREITYDKIICVLLIRLLTLRTGEKKRINLEEFGNLLKSVFTMTDIAAKFDKDKSDTLDPFELKEALSHSGFSVGFKTMQTLKEIFCDGGDFMGERGFLLCYTLFSILQVTRETSKSFDMFEDFSLKNWLQEQIEKATK